MGDQQKGMVRVICLAFLKHFRQGFLIFMCEKECSMGYTQQWVCEGIVYGVHATVDV